MADEAPPRLKHLCPACSGPLRPVKANFVCDRCGHRDHCCEGDQEQPSCRVTDLPK